MEDHDQRLKGLIQEFLPELFLAFFPAWFPRFDFARITWLEQEVFLDPPQGERRVIDLVARLPVLAKAGEAVTPGAPELALVHVEVEAADTSVPLRRRLFDSYVQLRRKHDRRILPLALFLRVGLDGLGVERYEERFDDLIVVQFQFLYVGLPALDAETYLNSENPLAVALSALMRAPRERRAELAAEAIRRLVESNQNVARKFLLCECVQAYSPLDDEQRRELNQRLLSAPNQGVMAMVKTWSQDWTEQGQRRLLARMLEKQFGPLSPQVQERLAAMSSTQLEELGLALLRAQSLKELGLED